MRNSALAFRVFTATLLLSAASMPLAAWDYKTCFGNLIKWDHSVVTFQASDAWFPAGSPPRNALNSAALAWNYSPGTLFRFLINYQGSVFFIGDGINSITFGPLNGALGITYYPWWDCGSISEKDIIFNISAPWTFDVNPPSPPALTTPYYFVLVALHELGHGMGLDHQDSTVATMSANYPAGGTVGNSNIVQPLADDLLGDRIGYGTFGSFHDVYASTYRVESSQQTGPIPRPSFAYRGEPVNFQFTIGNRGNTSEGSVRVQFYLSTDRHIDTSDLYLGASTFSLAEGSSGTFTATVTPPLSLPEGYYYFGIVVDPLNSIAEADEGNNAVALSNATFVPNYSPPIPCLSASPTFGPAPLDVQFSAACSSDPDGYITSYHWSFGDGGQQDGSVVSHRYWSPGYYTATLTVVDNMGLTTTADQNIVVVDPSGCLICG